jgi:hypothetical protein
MQNASFGLVFVIAAGYYVVVVVVRHIGRVVGCVERVVDESKCCVRLILVDIYSIYNKIKTHWHLSSRTRLEPRRRSHLFLSLPNPSLLFVHVVCPYIISIE